jgi:hypothetical protein
MRKEVRSAARLSRREAADSTTVHLAQEVVPRPELATPLTLGRMLPREGQLAASAA